MKHLLLTATTLALALSVSKAYADDDCYDAMADWQPQETLRQMLEAKDWQVNRIKVDDGCYEVKGLVDKAGNRIEASFRRHHYVYAALMWNLPRIPTYLTILCGQRQLPSLKARY